MQGRLTAAIARQRDAVHHGFGGEQRALRRDADIGKSAAKRLKVPDQIPGFKIDHRFLPRSRMKPFRRKRTFQKDDSLAVHLKQHLIA